ncbi:MAG TPA: hypothetical protein VGG22_12960 [Candidatus Baltobacteraceae bacterium]|jgi:hypothetical protein
MRLFLAALIFSAGAMIAAPVGAQTTTTTTVDVVGPHNPYCGSWQNGTFVPNGNCVEDAVPAATTTTVVEHQGRVMQRVRGTITSVQGHLVTVQMSTQTLVINDSPALSADQTGRVAVGRMITAHGYWEDGTFYATRFQ